MTICYFPAYKAKATLRFAKWTSSNKILQEQLEAQTRWIMRSLPMIEPERAIARACVDELEGEIVSQPPKIEIDPNAII